MMSSPKQPQRQLVIRFAWLAAAGALIAFAIGLMFFSRPGPASSGAGMIPSSGVQDETKVAAQDETTLEQLAKQTSGSAEEELLGKRLTNPSLSFRERREAALALGSVGSERSVALLAAALRSGLPPPLITIVATTLAASPLPEATQALRDTLAASDETAAGAAVRALAARGEPADANRLAELLFDTAAPEGVRAEAALALGNMPGPEALNALSRGASQITDEAISADVWQGLANRHFSETESVFQNYLNNPQVSVEAKVDALDALSEAEGNVAPLLLNFVTDSNPEIRLAAASSLGSTELSAEQIKRVLHSLAAEEVPQVRERLYDALSMQEHADPGALLQLAEAEKEPAARLSLYSLMAAVSRQAPVDTEFLSFFDRTAVPDLAQRAMGSGSYEQRLHAILILGRAGTPSALESLRELAGNLQDPKLLESAQSALKLHPRP